MKVSFVQQAAQVRPAASTRSPQPMQRGGNVRSSAASARRRVRRTREEDMPMIMAGGSGAFAFVGDRALGFGGEDAGCQPLRMIADIDGPPAGDGVEADMVPGE